MRPSILLALLALFFACGRGEPDGPGPIASLSIAPSSLELQTQDLYRLNLIAKDASGNLLRAPSNVRWVSSAPAVALVYSDGHVRAERPGQATITASHGGLEATIEVEVLPYPITHILLPPSLVLAPGQSQAVEGIPVDAGANHRPEVPISWVSLQPEVATVDEAGVVTAVREGEAWIHARAEDARSTLRVFVTLPSIERIELTGPSSALVGETVELTLRAFDRHGAELSLEGRQVGWGSSDPEVATVAEGIVTARSQGPVKLWAQVAIDPFSDASLSESLDFRVLGRPDRLELTAPRDHLWVGETVPLQLRVLDAEGLPLSGWEVLWSTTDPDALEVDGFGEVRAVGSGPATITAHVGALRASVDLEAEALRLKTFELGYGADCGLTTQGTVVCRRDLPWADDRSSSRFERAPGALSFRAVSLGIDHLCALTEEGVAHCVGSNGHGQLGDGTFDDATTFVEVPDLRFTSLSAGDRYTCGLTEAGTAHCWGFNRDGRLGDGTFEDRPAPTQVQGVDRPFAQLVAGFLGTTCGVTDEGIGHCWGDNRDGQLLEQKAPIPSPTPVAIPDVTFASIARPQGAYVPSLEDGMAPGAAVASGGAVPTSFPWGIRRVHLCGLTPAGVGRCWGDNELGQLGDGTTTRRDEPSQVGAPEPFESIHVHAGWVPYTAASCGLTRLGKLYCWGAYWGEDLHELPPDPLPALESMRFRDFTLAPGKACGVELNGLTYCWNGGLDPTPTLLPGQVP